MRKLLLQNNEKSAVFTGGICCLRIYCHVIENSQYLFENSFLIDPTRDEKALRVVMFDEIP